MDHVTVGRYAESEKIGYSGYVAIGDGYTIFVTNDGQLHVFNKETNELKAV